MRTTRTAELPATVPRQRQPAVEDVIADGLGLSQAEAAVAARIWEGDSINEAASCLSLSPNTVKTHLKAVFDKAGVDRQAALVRRIAQLL